MNFNPRFTARSTDENIQLLNLSSASEQQQEDDESLMVSVAKGAKGRIKRLDSFSSLSSEFLDDDKIVEKNVKENGKSF